MWCVVSTLGALLSAFGAAQDTTATGQRPAALVAFEQARRAVVSGRVEWQATNHRGAGATHSYVCRYARSGDLIFENRGDHDGWTVFDLSTGRGTNRYPQVYLKNADGFWRFQETGTHAMWWSKGSGTPNPLERHVKDIRAAGMIAASVDLEGGVGLQALYDAPEMAISRWVERDDGRIREVAADFESGATMKWYINPEKGWNAERVVFEHDGVVLNEAVCALKQYGEVWLPETTEYFERGELVETVRIKSALLNQPSDPARLTPGDMGMEAGTHIAPQDRPTEVGKPLIWNGEDISSWDRWEEDVKSGKREWGPTFRRIRAGEMYSSPYDTEEQRLHRKMAVTTLGARGAMSRHEGLWGRYVREFIKRYDLAEEQVQQANQLLQRCQERARDTISRNQAAWTSLELQLTRASDSGDDKAVRKLTERITELRRPIDEIFEKQLKPGLEKLPTRAQRKAAEEREHAATQPAEKPAP